MAAGRDPLDASQMDLLDRLTPEERARVRIDQLLEKTGWVLQDWSGHVDFRAAAGVAVREFITETGPVDYLLVADGKVAGSVEAKAEGHTLLSVENQTDRYNEGFRAMLAQRNLPRYADELPFQYVSTGTETNFQSRRDPIVRPREVFHFHRPEALAEWAQQDYTFRAKLRQMPPMDPAGLRDIQFDAVGALETSLANDRPRALAAITMGGGKTRLAVAEAYRLLRFAGVARRAGTPSHSATCWTPACCATTHACRHCRQHSTDPPRCSPMASCKSGPRPSRRPQEPRST